MKSIKHSVQSFLIALLIFSLAVPAAAFAQGQAQESGFTTQDVRYAFEHSMLPRYFYDYPEDILAGILDVGLYQLWESIATENGVDPLYDPADYIIDDLSSGDLLFIRAQLPDPDAALLCWRIYFLYDLKTGETGYYTIESEDFFPDICMLCMWTKDREHVDYGMMNLVSKDSPEYDAMLKREAETILGLSGTDSAIAILSTGETAQGIADSAGKDEIKDSEVNAEQEIADDKANLDEMLDGLDKKLNDSIGSVLEINIKFPTDDTENSEDAPAAGEIDTSGLTKIECPEQGFSVYADPAYSWNYEDGTGISIFTQQEGIIPYVIVYRGEDLIVEAFEYIEEQYTPHMQKQYGPDLVSYTEYEAYPIGGKEIPAGLYTYRLQGYLIDMLRLYDSTGDRTVAYTAKYIQGSGDETLKALDTAIRTFQAE